MADNASAAGPKSTFEAYRAEGDMLFKQQEFKKALESYDQVSVCFELSINVCQRPIQPSPMDNPCS